MKSVFSVLCAGFLLFEAATAAAQVVEIPIRPERTHFRLCGDDAAETNNGNRFGLAERGIFPGQYVRMSEIGLKSISGSNNNRVFINQGLAVLFSTNGTIFSTRMENRVPGAIPVFDQPNFVTRECYQQRLSTDIPHDFFVPGPNTEAPSNPTGRTYTDVCVPPGAAVIFISSNDSYFSDNQAEPFGEYGLRIEVINAPCDLDNSGETDVFDLLAYLDLWFEFLPGADLDENETVDIFDLLQFLDCFFSASQGQFCPGA